MSWDWVISTGIIVALILTIWAKVSKQKITDLLRDIIDLINEKREEVSEKVGYYG